MEPVNKTRPWAEPADRLADLVDRARQAGVELPDACCLATADAQGRPSARMVLMRGLDGRGPVVYTNLESDKGTQLAANPWAALCFHWQALVEQVRIEGPVELVSDAEADAYWASRPRDRQIGAWASDQSRALASRQALEDRVRAVEERFGDGPIPRPEQWSGWRLVAERWEFWEGRPGRVHHRDLYVPAAGPVPGWAHSLLQP